MSFGEPSHSVRRRQLFFARPEPSGERAFGFGL